MRVLLVVTLFAVLPEAARAADRTTVPVPLTVDEHGGVLVDVSVDAAGPFRFILDTGATRSVVADDLARDLTSPIVAQSDVVTSGGTELRPVARLGTVRLGMTRVDGLLAPVVPAARLASLGRGVRGLLGQDFLSAFNYTLDYRRRLLTWDDASRVSCDGRGAVRMERSEGRFVMHLTDANGAPLRLVPDSGAEALVLFGSADRSASNRRVLVSSVSGARGATLTRLPRLVVGSIELYDVIAVLVDRHEPEVDGLLPLHGFSSVSFAAGGACVVMRR